MIDVGAQITGKVLEFGKDPDHPDKAIDFGSTVHKNMLLAKIDPTYYQAQVDQADAAMKKAEAELQQLKALSDQAKNDWERAKELKPMNAIAGSDFDAAVANYYVAQANIAVGEATLKQTKAALAMAQINLNYTNIYSPVDGVIINRRVNIGQTVTASLNTPSMFLIAKDLRRMQVWVSVNEADVGRIRLDMPVSFTVDAHPHDTFRGTVTQIRMNAVSTQNVVMYTIIVTTDNPELKLYPYMTANVKFEVEHRDNVLLVPNAALQWKPDKSQIAPAGDQGLQADSSHKDKDSGDKAPADKPASKKASSSSADGGNFRKVWVLDGDHVRPLRVKIGITDNKDTEVSGDGVQEGVQVVIGEKAPGEDGDAEGTSNPFLPKFRRGHKSKSK